MGSPNIHRTANIMTQTKKFHTFQVMLEDAKTVSPRFLTLGIIGFLGIWFAALIWVGMKSVNSYTPATEIQVQ